MSSVGPLKAGASAVQPEPASGTLTFLFTDLEGSTRRWEQFPHAMKAALARHDAILGAAVAGSNGHVVKSTGDGMMAVFASAADGVRACVTAQRDLADEPWGEMGALRVRMGLHAGEAATRTGDYLGPVVNRTARIMAVGHGGQALLSAAAAALVLDQLPEGATLLDLGSHRLKDLERPEHLFQLVHPDLAHDFPPLATLDRHPNNLPTPGVHLRRARRGAGGDQAAPRGPGGAAAHPHRAGRHGQDPPGAAGGRRRDRPIRRRRLLC
jgi:class 3 adenylate cyclase